MPEALEVFGVPLSQPVRAVVWACMIKRLPFELKMIVPGFTISPYGSRSPEYLGKTRLRDSPLAAHLNSTGQYSRASYSRPY